MFPYALSPDVLQDLQDIWDFIASDNVAAADKLEDEFFEAFEMLAKRPRMGHARSDLTEQDVRFWPVGKYLIVYRSLKKPLGIVAILHGARDVAEVIRKR
jgi:toxin ParE1/3/4